MSNPLEEYLTQFHSSLKGIPTEQRDAEVEETRQHLQSLIQQRVENGEPETVAIATALQQFGSAQETGKALRKIWRRESNESRMHRLLTVSHRLFAIAIIYSAVINLLFAAEFYARSPRIVWATLSLYHCPTLFDHWGLWSSSDIYIPTLAMSYALSGMVASFSLRYPREMRTVLFAVSTSLIATHIFASAMWDFYTLAGRSPFYSLCIFYGVRITGLSLSGFGLCISLARDKSLISRPKRPRAI